MALLALALLAALVTAVLVRRGTLRWAGACALVAVATLSAGAIELTRDVVTDNGAARFDPTALNWVVPHRRGWLTALATTVTDLGATTTMGAVAIAACAWLAWRRRWAESAFVASAAVGAAVIGSVLKPAVGRDRPPPLDRLVAVAHPSFPSGHTLGATAVVGALTVLVLLSPARRAVKLTVSTVATIFVVAVGLSRLYLGVHWFTDVLAGWCLGALWLIVCLIGYRIATRPRPSGRASPRPARR
ncbi:phosphatase PAP2 family protein [Nocardia sp. NPDC003482]